MIVKVTEPNNCTIGRYGGVPNNNYYSGRTMYRYYRCMPIYQQGVHTTDVTHEANRLATMNQDDGVHNKGVAGRNVTVKPGTIIGFASFQELTILELASLQKLKDPPAAQPTSNTEFADFRAGTRKYFSEG